MLTLEHGDVRLKSASFNPASRFWHIRYRLEHPGSKTLLPSALKFSVLLRKLAFGILALTGQLPLVIDSPLPVTPETQSTIPSGRITNVAIASLISEIDAEIARLQHARTLLASGAVPAPKKRGRPAKAAGTVPSAVVAAKPVKRKKRSLSPEGRARIAAAAKARWAKQKTAKK